MSDFTRGSIKNGKKVSVQSSVKTLRKALITTAYGQDSIFLGRLLRSKEYEVLVFNNRQSPPQNHNHFDHSVDTDITKTEVALQVIEQFRPQEIYNLAAVSSVARSWEDPSLAMEVNGDSVKRLIQGISTPSLHQTLKFFQAGSTDMVGKTNITPEDTDFSPWSPYGQSKEAARQAILFARGNQGFWGVNGILTNHDSKYRAKTFVIPLIANQIKEILKGERKVIQLENPSIARDWAHAKDIMEAAWKMMQLDEPQDLVLATGVTNSLEELIAQCSLELNIPLDIEQLQTGSPRKSDFTSIKVDAGFAHKILEWKPQYSGPSTLMSLIQ